MADYTPTTEEVRDGFADNSFAGTETVLRAAFDRWLAAHDAEVRASVLAEQGEPEWEFICDGKDRHGGGVRQFTDSPENAQYLADRGYTVRRRTKAIPAGPWLPVEENKLETMTACCATSEPCEKHQDARHQEAPESTDGSER